MKVVKKEQENVIELSEIKNHHSIVCRIRDLWFMLVRNYKNDYCAVRLDNNTILMEDIDVYKIKNLSEWYEMSVEMHVFINSSDLFKFMLD